MKMQLLSAHAAAVTRVAFTGDSRWFVTTGLDGIAHLWNLATLDPTHTPVVLSGHSDGIRTVLPTPDSRRIITGSLDRTARIWDLPGLAAPGAATILPDHNPYSPMSVSADSRLLAAGRRNHSVRCYRLRGGGLEGSGTSLRGPQRGICAVAFSPDSTWLAAAAVGEAVFVWKLAPAGECMEPLVLPTGDQIAHTVAFGPTSDSLIASDYNAIRLWRLNMDGSAQERDPLHRHKDAILGFVVSRNRRWLVSYSADNNACVWDLALEEPSQGSRLLQGHRAPLVSAAISPDDRWLASGDTAGAVRLWELTAQDPAERVTEFSVHRGLANHIAFSPDSRWLATGSGYWDSSAGDPRVMLWDLLQDGTLFPVELTAHRADIVDLAFSADGNWLGTGSADGTACIWSDF